MGFFTERLRRWLDSLSSPRRSTRGAPFRRLSWESLEARIAPAAQVLSITRTTPASELTNASTVHYTVTFIEAVTGVDEGDFQLATTGSVTGEVTAVTAVSPAVYTVTVGGITGNGTVGMNLLDDGTIHDLSGARLFQPEAGLAYREQPVVFQYYQPSYELTADVNGDGRPDLIGVYDSSLYTGRAQILLGNGNGTFRFAGSFDVGFEPRKAVVADVNNDGRPDVLTSNDGSSTFSVLVNTTPTGTDAVGFEAHTINGLTNGLLVVADINGDGRLDILSGSQFNNEAEVLLGLGDGTFNPVPRVIDLPQNPGDLAAADVDGDGRLDLLERDIGGQVDVFKNGTVPGGTSLSFTLFQTIAVPAHSVAKVKVADLNHDSHPDLILTTQMQLGSDQALMILPGLPGGRFDDHAWASFAGVDEVEDIDGDGNLDLAGFHYPDPNRPGSATVLLGHGDGSFLAPITFAVPWKVDAVATDVDLDGRPDLLDRGKVLLNLVHGHFTGPVYTIDRAAPFVRSIEATAPTLTLSSSVSYKVTFSEPVTGVGPGVFQARTTGGLSAARVDVTPVSGSVYSVTVSGLAGHGTVSLDLVDDGTVRDLAGNRLTAATHQPAFQEQTPGADGNGVTSFVVADLDGDGKSDLVLNGLIPYVLRPRVLLGNGDGTFRSTYLGPEDDFALDVADFNRDGRLDLLVGNGDTLSVLLGDGQGSFQPQAGLWVGTYSRPLAVADFNGDLYPDLAWTNNLVVKMSFGNGDGTFRPPQAVYPTNDPSSRAWSVAAADVNGDGNSDLLVSWDNGNTPLYSTALLGYGDGTFEPRQSNAVLHRVAAVSDLDGDVSPDLVDVDSSTSRVVIFSGRGDGTFRETQSRWRSTSFSWNLTPVLVDDVNQDGESDLVFSNLPVDSAGTYSVVLGSGHGVFQPARDVLPGLTPWGVGVGDFDGDGRPDLVTGTVNASGTPVTVYQNVTSGSVAGPTYTVNIDSAVLQATLDQLAAASGGSPTTVSYAVTGQAALGAFLAAVNGLLPESVPTTITLVLAPGNYDDVIASPKAGTTLVLRGNGGTTTVVGHSPALTVSSGDVVITGVTFTTDTDSPTVLVTGGSLTLRDDVIEESTGFNSVAIAVTGGTLDLGTAGDPGNNVLNVNGVGEHLLNTTTNMVSMVGSAFEIDGVLIPNRYVVRTDADSGPGSLRQAILDANATPNNTAGPDVIRFAIPGTGVHTLRPLSALPAITDATFLDGWSQPGFAGTPVIELDGSLAGYANGLTIVASDTTVRGLVVGGFLSSDTLTGTGIAVAGAAQNVWLAGNYLGVDPTGTAAHGNGYLGVHVFGGASHVLIGTNLDGVDDAAERNVISANVQMGVRIEAASNITLWGNYVGTNASGDAALPNTEVGIGTAPGASGLTIGGAAPGAGNLISGNTFFGVHLSPDTYAVTIQGNRIGTNAAGTAAIANRYGVAMEFDTHDVLVGGPGPGEGNLVSGNDGIGVWASHGTHDITIQGNRVGTDLAGTYAIPNGQGVTVLGRDVLVAGNLISGNSQTGLSIEESPGGVRVEGNRIGTDATGTYAVGNLAGIDIRASAWVTVGGTTAAARNLISGNETHGVAVANGNPHDNVIRGNYIGTDVTGTQLLGNGAEGVLTGLTGPNNLFADNLVSGNVFNGFSIYWSSGVLVRGNNVGTNAAGTAALPNAGNGVAFYESGDGNVIGGSSPADRNLISGNMGHGILMWGIYYLHDNAVLGNLIGTDTTGTLAIPNSGSGIVAGGVNNRIGGAGPGQGNTVAYNLGDGVAVQFGVGIAIRSNSIHDNEGLGIHLGQGAATVNDPGDADDPNNFFNGLQNYPVLAMAAGGPTPLVTGTLNSTPNGTFTLDFYANPGPDPFGLAEGRRYLGSGTVTTDAGGNASFQVRLAGAAAVGEVITATATDPGGSTSEFSAGVPAALAADAGGPYSIPEGGTLTLSATAGAPPDGTLSYSWDVNGDGTFGDATGASPTLTWARLQALGIDDGFRTYAVAVRVDDGHGHLATASSALTLRNAAPVAAVAGPADGYRGVRGQARILTVSAADASSADALAGFRYAIAWGDGATLTVNPSAGNGTGVTVSHAYAGAGTYTVSVTATDKDGGTSSTVTLPLTILTTEAQGGFIAIGGTPGDDAFLIKAVAGGASVSLNGAALGTFGPLTAAFWVYGNGGSDAATLQGTTGDDTFSLQGRFALLNDLTFGLEGFQLVTLDGRGGSDRFTNWAATVASVLLGAGGNETFTFVGTMGAPAQVFGGAGVDTLVAPALDNTWTLTGADSGTLNGFTFSEVENLTGGDGSDRFSFGASGSVSGVIDGGYGFDSLDYSAYGAPVGVNLQTRKATATRGFANVESFVGGADADTLTAADAANAWSVTDADRGAVGDFEFAGFESLTGGALDDTFAFGPSGSVSGKVDGKAGVNALDYSGYGGPVVVDLQAKTATALAQPWARLSRFVGGASVDRILGPDAGNAWHVTGVNVGDVNRSATFAGFEDLVGGAKADAFQFGDGARVTGTVDGRGGTNRLDLSPYTTSVVVNLSLGKATATGGVSNVQDADGGQAADELVGDAGDNALSGGGGNDILIGGAGEDTLRGGGGSDLLVGGTTDFDANAAALAALLAEWGRTDVDLAARTGHLQGTLAGGLNGAYRLVAGATVHDDGASDALYGEGDRDWFFALLAGGKKDKVKDPESGEQITGL